ncbi:homocysteine S-methyltransferase [Leucobacter zeae]|nr:homocysteine S-methyltransferase [Leucobacter zeae]
MTSTPRAAGPGSRPSLVTALARGPVALDGGLGTRLDARGNDVTGALWSAEILRGDPGEVRAAHADFFAAGAEAAITSSYQVSHEGFARAGVSAGTVDDLLVRSVELAREAATDSLRGERSFVLASIGPFGASLGDGSEYTGAYGEFAEVSALRAWHARRLRVLADARPDALLAETIPLLAEAEAVCAEAEGLGVPLLLSFTVADGRLRSGESIADAARLAARAQGAVAVGVNCASADDATAALRIMAGVCDLPLMIYPNSGEVWDASARSWTGTARPLAEYVDEWIALGARLIGGCCRVDAGEVREISDRVARVAAHAASATP